MRVIQAIRKNVMSIAPDATLAEASEVMERANVGALVVLDGAHLTGIVTDRDFVRRGVAHGLPPDARIDAVMTPDVVTLDADADIRAALHCSGLMHVAGRRSRRMVRSSVCSRSTTSSSTW
jgi:CBS domain-containing protein